VSDNTQIEWAEASWNPVVGCSPCSPGCDNCYAARMAHRLGHNPATPQYAGLQALYDKFRDRGFVVLGFPCNQFGRQEPSGEAEIEQFCTRNYGVAFPMYEKIEVNGVNAHPLYKYLKSEKPGILGTEAIKWNFTKFLVGTDGTVLKRYAPSDKPEAIEADLAARL
jgi:glutathione peroxidase